MSLGMQNISFLSIKRVNKVLTSCCYGRKTVGIFCEKTLTKAANYFAPQSKALTLKTRIKFIQ